MSARRIAFYLSLAFLLLVLVGIPIRSQFFIQTGNGGLIAGRNVNMVSGTKLPLGDPWLQRQNEPSIAASSRNWMHLFAAANDYRTIDMSDNYNLRGIPGFSAVRDSWVGVFESFDAGESWVTTLLPGFPQDTSMEGLASPIHGFDTACDPIVRAGAKGLFYFSGIAFNRSQQAGAVFVARYVDLNNREKVEEGIDPASGYKKLVGPIEYMDTKLADTGNPGQFIDMPNMAVDVPRSGAPYGNVYLAYTVFLGNTDINVRSRLVFRRSTDGGATWGSAIKLTESQHIIQRPVIAIDPSDPTGKTIYVVFRRFAFGNTPGGIVFVKSLDGGISFTKPADVATLLYPFDQPTTANSFRTNSYPTMAVDGSGTAYVAWAQRYTNGLPSADGQARIVISYLPKGSLTWLGPQIVDSYMGDGHQFMPTMTFAGGRLMLAWYDQRNDFNLDKQSDKKFIKDSSNYRHTIDVRAAEGTPGTPPTFLPSIQVSRYLYYFLLDDLGNPTGDLIQGEASFINEPLFSLGTQPFHGDYIEIASAPQILPPPAASSSNWSFNIADPTTFPVAWTDNRNVWPPGGSLWGDWTKYNPPTSTQDGDFSIQIGCTSPNHTGMKNQNVYAANLNHGIIVGSPGNTKQLDIDRTFVVFVKNTTETEKSLQLIINNYGGPVASFDQFNAGKSSLDVIAAPYASVSTSVYVNAYSSKPFAPARVDVKEGNGVVGYVILNPDSTNNPIDLGNEYHSPIITNPKIFKYDVGNKNEPNASFLGPRAENPRAENSGYVNPRAENVGIKNPRAENPRAENFGLKNENIANYELKNPRAENPRAENSALTDMTWTVTNNGNTTSAYTFDIRSTVADYFNADPSDPNYIPPLIAQILVYKVHTVPIDDGCDLYQTHADELILNVTNPRAENPRAENPAPTAKNIAMMTTTATTQDIGTQDVTFHLAPGEQAEVTLRVYDPDITDPIAFDTQTVAAETTAEAADTGQTTPPEPVPQPNIPWVNPLPTIVAVPSSLTFNGGGTKNISLSLSNLPSGSLAYSASTDSSWLSVSPASGYLSGAPTTLTVTVTTTGLNDGSYTGFITVTVPEASNNPLRIPVFLYKGAYLAPFMDIYVTENYIQDGDSFDFGACALGSTTDVTFDIYSSCETEGDLILRGQPIITIMGANANQFSVQQQPTSPVTCGDYTSFKIRFQPTSVGLKTATISIANNTLGTNPYDITLQGTGLVAPGLVAYYPFNGNANDESGNGNNGTVNGATLTLDRFGNTNSAYYFNGTSAYIEVPDSNSLDVTGGLTIMAWVKPDINNVTLPIVNKYRSDFGYRAYWLYGWTVGEHGPWFRVCTGGPAENIGDAYVLELLPTTSWTFVSGTYDGSEVKLYINGTLKNTGTVSGMINTNSLPLRIGADDELQINYFKGSMDDIRIYNGALSASEIQALYNREQGMVAYYPFNGNANDETGNGLDGEPLEALLATDRFENEDSAYSFDGQNDAITVQSNPLLDITGPITLAAWIYPLEQKTQDIVRRSVSPSSDPYGLATSETGDIIFELSFGGVLQQVRKSGYDLNAWSFIVGTWDGSTMRLYVNGALVASQSKSGVITTDPNSSLLIGTRLRLPADTFHGLLDDIRIYNRALSASEISALYGL
jgi:hypothetical protein